MAGAHGEHTRQVHVRSAFRHELRKAREKRGWSQSDLAGRLGLKRKDVEDLEHGNMDPSLSLLRQWAKCLRVSNDKVKSGYRD